MAKNSGTTRTQGLNGNTQQPQGAGERFIKPAMMEQIAETMANAIEKYGWFSFEGAQRDAWGDMTTDERDLTLMYAGFTGMIDEDEYENFGTIYIPMDKKKLVEELKEQLVNDWQGYGVEESTMFTIGYKDGSRKYLSQLESDFEPSRPVTNRTTSRSASELAQGSIKLRDVAYIIRSNGYDEPNYWVANNDTAKELLRKYGNFEFWRKGRGEKRRSYIQDDWI